MSEPIYGGVEVVLGGRTFLVPPLSLAAMRRLKPKIEAGIKEGKFDFDLVLEVGAAALKRNYPELTDDKIGDLLDLVTGPQVYEAAMLANAAGPNPPEPKPGEASAP